MTSTAHRPDGELRALLDGELPATHTAAVQQHVAACTTCHARLAEVERNIHAAGALLSLLEAPAPSLRLEAVVRRASRTSRRQVGLIAAAAMLVVVVAAGATVGRPYMRALAARFGGIVWPKAPPPRRPETPAGAEAGVAVVPGVVAEIVFDSTQARGVVRVSLADTVELAVRASEPVTYRVYPVGVTVHNGGAQASYDVVVPRAAPQVRIVVAGRVIFEKVGPRIVAATPADSAGWYVLNVR